MAKNILIYSDGTGQAGGIRPDQELSNIYKMYRASKVSPDSTIDPSMQIAFYDQGLGSGKRDGGFLSHPIKTTKKLLSLAIGAGINTNIVDCYEAILKHYEPGDRIYLFGFSRGAYTVRCVANLMNLCGVPTHDKDGSPVPRFGARLRAIAEEAVYRVYEHGVGQRREDYEEEQEELAHRFRQKYGSEGVGKNGESQGNVQPYFIGVFDTVAALGLNKFQKFFFRIVPGALAAIAIASFFFWDFSPIWGGSYLAVFISAWIYILVKRFRYIKDYPNKGDFKWNIKSWGLENYDKFLDNLVPYARHAISIDEERKNFPRVGWGHSHDFELTKDQKPVWLRQVWFSGNHSDIGGSYPEAESRLSDITLQWMIEQIEEVEQPVIFNKKMLNLFPQPKGMQHCEIKSTREKVWPNWWPQEMRFSWPKQVRKIHKEAELHSTVIERFKYDFVSDYGHSAPYRPETLRNHEKVKGYYSDTE
jgi:uncharacterized protein (DUF2235 family)